MKNLKLLLFSGLTLMLVVSSCTIVKRVHMSGYHVEWLDGKHNPNKNELANNDNSKKSEQNKIVTVPQDSELNTDNSTTVNEENITASVDNSVTLPLHKPVLFTDNNVKKTTTVLAVNSSIDKFSVHNNFTNKNNAKANPKRNTDKFLTLWLGCWGVGLVLYLIAILALTGGGLGVGLGLFGVLILLSYVAWLAGFVFGILWLVKKFS